MEQPQPKLYSWDGLTVEDLNTLLAGLHLLPYAQAHPLVQKFHRNLAELQAKANVKAASA
jgi:hypothetical protein